jgi:hypothetical protein
MSLSFQVPLHAYSLRCSSIFTLFNGLEVRGCYFLFYPVQNIDLIVVSRALPQSMCSVVSPEGIRMACVRMEDNVDHR